METRLLDGKSVVITGAGSGVGKAAALLFAENGAKVVVADIREDWIEQTVARIGAEGGTAVGARCDVSRRADVDAAVANAVDTFGRLDVIYNNAGVSSPLKPDGKGMKSFAEASDDDIDRLYAINVKGVIYGCQAAIAQFRKQGGGGVIVNTASVAGMIGWGGALYGSTKGAVVNLARSLAVELGPENIRVNNVCPGSMVTNFGIGAGGDLPPQVLEGMARIQPLGRIIDPVEPARVALFLASDLSINITGINVPVDGGVSAGK